MWAGETKTRKVTKSAGVLFARREKFVEEYQRWRFVIRRISPLQAAIRIWRFSREKLVGRITEGGQVSLLFFYFFCSFVSASCWLCGPPDNFLRLRQNYLRRAHFVSAMEWKNGFLMLFFCRRIVCSKRTYLYVIFFAISDK